MDKDLMMNYGRVVLMKFQMELSAWLDSQYNANPQNEADIAKNKLIREFQERVVEG